VSDLPEAFFLPLGELAFRATTATQGPWDPGAMHGGPVAALIATLLTDRVRESSDSLRLTRLTVDFLGPLPLGDLDAAVTVPRPGRRIALAEATLSAGGRTFAVGRGWFIDAGAAGGERPVDLAGDQNAAGEVAPLAAAPPLPGEQPQRFFSGDHTFGYGAANEWRFTSGGFDTLGPAGVWSRARVPLLTDRPMTGLARLLVLADAANGISGDLPFGEWVFIPPGITVTFLREPTGEWVHLAARTTLGDDGIGLTHGHLADADGPVAIVSQPLLVARA
jgi:acyl-coenzyme A thioesterase PaaI-like protein